MSYIKKVNWPWVELETGFYGQDSGLKEPITAAINMDDVDAVWDCSNIKYKSGIRFKDGSWLDGVFIDAAITELKKFIMEKL